MCTCLWNGGANTTTLNVCGVVVIVVIFMSAAAATVVVVDVVAEYTLTVAFQVDTALTPSHYLYIFLFICVCIYIFLCDELKSIHAKCKSKE